MTVYAGRGSRPSARVLDRALLLAGYDNHSICWGHVERLADRSGMVNGGVKLNKRLALLKMQEQGVPIPKLYLPNQLGQADYPLVGRPDRHRAGRHFYLCHDRSDCQRAINRGASHFLEFIEDAREFRVHIAFGKSIKIAEKVGGTGHIKNRQNGWYFGYPQSFDHKLTLRRVAKQAVMAISLDFGAVDMLYKDSRFYVLEVNSAPSLTSRSDTLERYVKAFLEQC